METPELSAATSLSLKRTQVVVVHRPGKKLGCEEFDYQKAHLGSDADGMSIASLSTRDTSGSTSAEQSPSTGGLYPRAEFEGSSSRPAEDGARAKELAVEGGPRVSMAQPPRAGDLRRRKYRPARAPAAAGLAPHSPRSEEAAVTPVAPSGRAAAHARGAREPPDTSTDDAARSAVPGWNRVLIEGPLQQRNLLGFWRWRWCVLVRVFDTWELRVYGSQAEALGAPDQPLSRQRAAGLAVDLNPHHPSVLSLLDGKSGEGRLVVRAGCGKRWEELAASSLWRKALAGAGAVRALR